MKAGASSERAIILAPTGRDAAVAAALIREAGFYANPCGDLAELVHEIEGTWYTTGDPLRFMKTNVEYMLRHPEFGAEFSAYLRELDLKSF